MIPIEYKKQIDFKKGFDLGFGKGDIRAKFSFGRSERHTSSRMALSPKYTSSRVHFISKGTSSNSALYPISHFIP